MRCFGRARERHHHRRFEPHERRVGEWLLGRRDRGRGWRDLAERGGRDGGLVDLCAGGQRVGADELEAIFGRERDALEALVDGELGHPRR